MKKIFNKLFLFITLCTTALCVGCNDDDNDNNTTFLPEIVSFYPKSGGTSQEITIAGYGFGTAGTIYFGETEATGIRSYSDSKIRVLVPEGATTGPIKIQIGTNTVTSADTFTYTGTTGGIDDGYPTGTFAYRFSLDDVVYNDGESYPLHENNSEGNDVFTIWDCESGDQVILKVEITTPGYYYVYSKTSTPRDGTYMNVMIDTDWQALKDAPLNNTYSKDVENNGNWTFADETLYGELNIGAFLLEEAGTYYVRMTLVNETWVTQTGCIRYLQIHNYNESYTQ